jgi:hypothetical protein
MKRDTPELVVEIGEPPRSLNGVPLRLAAHQSDAWRLEILIREVRVVASLCQGHPGEYFNFHSVVLRIHAHVSPFSLRAGSTSTGMSWSLSRLTSYCNNPSCTSLLNSGLLYSELIFLCTGSKSDPLSWSIFADRFRQETSDNLSTDEVA